MPCHAFLPNQRSLDATCLSTRTWHLVLVQGRAWAFACPSEFKPITSTLICLNLLHFPQQEAANNNGGVVDQFAKQLPLHTTTTTIMFVDVVESVRLVQSNEREAVERIRALLAYVANHLLTKHKGELIQRMGDGLLTRFPSPRLATTCATEIHRFIARIESSSEQIEPLQIRIGIHAAQVLTDESAIYGAGVNLASRITQLASPGSTLITAEVRDQLIDGVDGYVFDLGECYLKHLSRPIRVYRHCDTDTQAELNGTTLPNLAIHLKPTITILPFIQFNNEKSETQIGIGDLFADQLINALSVNSTLRVISGLTSLAFKSRNDAFSIVSQKVSADYVLSGRCTQLGDKFSVSLELTQLTTHQVIWADGFEASVNEVLSVQSDAVRRVITAVSRSIYSAETEAAFNQALPNLASHTLYLGAISLLHRFSMHDFEHSRALLEALHERAPRLAAPLAWLARWHVFRVVQGWSPSVEKDREIAKHYSNRALDLDAQSSLALTISGSVDVNMFKDIVGAQEKYRAALAVNPNESLAMLLLGTAKSFEGQGHEALDYCQSAISLSPLDPARFLYEAISAFSAQVAGDYEKAIELAKSSLRLNCRHSSTLRTLAITQSLMGRIDDARRTVSSLLELEPQLTVERYVERSPARNRELLHLWSEALASAGLPRGQLH